MDRSEYTANIALQQTQRKVATWAIPSPHNRQKTHRGVCYKLLRLLLARYK